VEKTKKIVLDTNFIIAALQFKIGLFSELRRVCDFGFEVCVLSASLGELEKLINNGNLLEKKQAALALRFIREKNIKVLTAEGIVDDLLMGLDKQEFVIATQDARLRAKLKAKGYTTIVIRQKKHLIIE